MSEKYGGPAWPYVAQLKDTTGNTFTSSAPGMSLRDYFAGQALLAFGGPNVHEFDNHFGLARECYALADALLKARTQGES